MKILDKFRATSKKVASARADLQADVEELRNELSRLNSERRKIEDAPLTREQTAENIRRHLDHLESEAVDRLAPSSFRSAKADSMAPNADDVFAVSSGVAGGGGAFFATSSKLKGVGGLCVLGFRSQIEAALLEKAMAAVPGDGLSASERDAKLRKINSDIDAVEGAEEQLIREAEHVGIEVFRRMDARPEIYLAESL